MSLRLGQDPRPSQRQDQTRVGHSNRRQIPGPNLCWHPRSAWSSWFVAPKAGGLGPRGAPEHSGRGAPEPETARRKGGLRAPVARRRRHCWPSGRSLPEVVHLAEDLLVLDVAAVLLPQRRATHGALEAPHVPDEVVDLGRGRRWGAAQRGPLHARPQPPRPHLQTDTPEL